MALYPGTWWYEPRYYSPSHTIPTSLNLCVLTAHLVAFRDLTRLSRTATSTSLCPVWFHCHVGGSIVTWAVPLSRGRLHCHVGGYIVTWAVILSRGRLCCHVVGGVKCFSCCGVNINIFVFCNAKSSSLFSISKLIPEYSGWSMVNSGY